MSFASDLYQGYAKSQDAQFNTAVARQEGQNAMLQAGAAEGEQRFKNQMFMGRQAAAAAQSGTGPGSTTLVQQQSAAQSELDALTTRYKGILTKHGYDTEADNFDRQGHQAMTAAFIKAGADLVGQGGGAGYGG
jgi:4-diphosphocytidyl-2C-methyl-D-erythritol kinase